MPVRVIYRPVGEGFVVDTPQGSMLILDPDLSPREQALLAAELLEEGEFADLYSVPA